MLSIVIRVLNTNTCSLKRFPLIIAMQTNASFIAPLRGQVNWKNAIIHYGEVNVVNNVQDIFHLKYIIMFILFSKARTVSFLWPRRTTIHLAMRSLLQRTPMILMKNKVSHLIGKLFCPQSISYRRNVLCLHDFFYCLLVQGWSCQMETSTGTAHAWVAWPVVHVAPNSKRRFPASTIAKRRWRAQSV